MSRIPLIVEREYFSRVKKKSFLLTTILAPLLLVGFYVLIIYIAVSGNKSSSSKIAIIDESGLVQKKMLEEEKAVQFELKNDQQVANFKKEYKAAGYDALLHIPKIDLKYPKGFEIFSKSSVSFSTMNAAEDLMNKAIEAKRMEEKGINLLAFDSIKANISIANTIETNTGYKENVAGLAYGVSFACGILIYMMMLIYGSQVMRGVSEEKTNRISEVIVSSTKPFDLMMGKVIGIGLVGLTQFLIWIVLGLLLTSAASMFLPNSAELAQQMNPATSDESNLMAQKIMSGISSLPLLKIGFSFLFYFLFGYLTYAALFAAVGSVVSDDQNEAQALVMPIMMPIIIGFVIMIQAINNPNTPLAVFGSIFPLTSPVVMMGRITYDVPWWQLLLSGFLLVGTFVLLTWLAAKIYRVGILMYGKKPSWRQMMKWAFSK